MTTNSMFSNLRGDLLGGITAGIVALPLALAFGVSSGLGPSAGLYGAIFLSFFAALFGGTPTQISGPTAPMTAVSMVVIASIIGANDGIVEKALPYILLVFLLAGLMQIGLGFLKVGQYVKYIPYPVVSGFMTAIGVIILITQILPMLGYYPANDEEAIREFIPQAEEVILEKILADETGEGILVLEDFEETISRAGKITKEEIHKEAKNLAKNAASGVLGTIKVLPRAMRNINFIEVLLCLITIFIIYGFKRITKAIPSTLVALLVVTLGAVLLKVDYVKIAQIPQGLPLPQLGIFKHFDVTQISPYLFTALTLALLGAIDSLLTSVIADNMTKTSHNSNKELIGQGIGNSIGALFGGIPGAGATIRTVVNINAGGKTRLSGMVAGILLLVILLALGPIASKIPAAVLAGILITVGIGVMDYKGLRAIPVMPRSEVIIMIVVLVLSVFWNLVYAVGVGLVISSIIFMKKMGDFTGKKSGVRPLKDEAAWPDEVGISEEIKSNIAVKHIEGPLFFGSKAEVQSLTTQVPTHAKAVIIRMDKMPYIDQSGLFSLEDVILELEKKDVQILIVGLQEQPKVLMEAIDIIPDLVSHDNVFDDFASCNNWLEQNLHKLG